MAGIRGAGVAEAGVALLIVLPFYLGVLKSAGVGLGALAKNLCLPIVAAAVCGLIAAEAAKVAPSDFTALAVSGLVTVAIVGLLIYRMRPTLALLRRSSAEPAGGEGATAGTGASTYTDDVTAELAAIWGVIDALPSHYNDIPDPVRREARLSSRLAYPDFTGPMRLQSVMAGHFPAEQDFGHTSPLYWQTAASQWGADGGTGPGQVPHHRSNGRGNALRANGVPHQRSPVTGPDGRGEARVSYHVEAGRGDHRRSGR
jgi:hypothetical protein